MRTQERILREPQKLSPMEVIAVESKSWNAMSKTASVAGSVDLSEK